MAPIDTCKLCLLVKELRDSHYIPRRAYSMNMAKSLVNPNPVVVSHGKLKQVSDQLRGYTFCGDCEQMLSSKGEKWVLANISEDYASIFPLQEALIPENPLFINDNFNVYEGRKIKAFDIDQLVYFGMSMFWRGAARQWKSSQGALAPTVDLGEQYEPIRKFLLGDVFPDDVVIFVLIHNLKPPMNLATTVLKATHSIADFYWFYLNGLGFKLYLGKNIPRSIRDLCVYRSAAGFVMVDRAFGEMVKDFAKETLTTHQRSGKFEDFLKGPAFWKKP